MRATIAAWRGLAPVGIAAFLLLGQSSTGRAQSEAESGLDIDVAVVYLYDDNVTRAPSGPDKRSDQFYGVNATKSFAFPVTDFSRVTLDAVIGGELARNYSGLGNFFGGLLGALQYRESTQFGAPTFALFARGFGEHFGSALRSGFRYAAGLSMRQPVTERLGVFGSVTHNWRYAKSSVFETHDNSALLSADYSLGPHGTVTLTGEYRRGTIVSTGQKSLQIIDIAQVFVVDDVFTSPAMIDYRLKAQTVLTTLVYLLPVGPTSSLEFSWRRAESRSTERASFPGGGKLEYVDNQFGAVFVVRF